jgi:dihydrofolate reductase
VTAQVMSSMSMSLDGFVTARDDSREHPLGIDGQRLHRWIFEGTEADEAVLSEMVEGAGAVVMGRRSYDQVAGDGGWGGQGPVGPVPCFVLSHRPAPPDASDVFTFVDDGIESALAQARRAAGDKVVGLHGASSLQQALEAGLVDVIQVHLVPVLLGRGVRLFDHLDGIALRHVELERDRVVETPDATHLRFRVVRD